MYLNESLSEIKTPAFLVNQLASVFDTQCNLAGSIIDMGQGFAAILQLKCITGEGPWHECFQYSDKCSGGPRGQVLGVIKPFQQQLIDESRAGLASEKLLVDMHNELLNIGNATPASLKMQGSSKAVVPGTSSPSAPSSSC